MDALPGGVHGVKWIRLLIVLLAVVPQCGALVSQEGPPITIILYEEFTGDQSAQGAATLNFTVPAANNKLMIAFFGAIEKTPWNMINVFFNWDNAGTPQALTVMPYQRNNIPGGSDPYHFIAYLLDPSEVTGDLFVQQLGVIDSLSFSVIVLENVDQDDPFDFANLLTLWPTGVDARSHFSLPATNQAFLIDHLTKFDVPVVPPHALGTTGAHQNLEDNQEVGDGGSVGVTGWTSVSSFKIEDQAPIIFGMYRENTNVSFGGVHAIYHIREASRCVAGPACTFPP